VTRWDKGESCALQKCWLLSRGSPQVRGGRRPEGKKKVLDRAVQTSLRAIRKRGENKKKKLRASVHRGRKEREVNNGAKLREGLARRIKKSWRESTRPGVVQLQETTSFKRKKRVGVRSEPSRGSGKEKNKKT